MSSETIMSKTNKLSERLALHTWSLDTTPLAEALKAARDGGWNAVELRRVDFVRCFDKGMTNDEVIALVRESGMKVATLGAETGFLFATGFERTRLFGALEETAANARALGCDLIMAAPGQNRGTVKEAAANFRTAGELVSKYGCRIALEFNCVHAVINRLAIGREIVALAAHPACGLLLDAYHMERAGDGGRSFEDMPVDEIFAVQVSDVPHGPPPAGNPPVDRLVPGQGRVRWNDFFGLLAEKRYAGYVSYEAPNPELWARAPAEVAREAAAAIRRLLAQVE
jgi:2-keto-myo-inositol isomerase